MRHVKRTEEPDSADSVEPEQPARGRAGSRVLKLVVALALGGLAYYFAEQLLELWSPTTVVTETVRMVFGASVAVLVLALAVLVPAALGGRRTRKAAAQSPATDAAQSPATDAALETPEETYETSSSLESELSAAAAELAAELERAANAGVPEALYDDGVSELDIEGAVLPEEQSTPVIVAVDPPQAMAAIAIPVWVEETPIEEAADEAAAPQSETTADARGEVGPLDVAPIAAEPVGELPVGEVLHEELPIDDTPDADGNTNPTVRVLQAQIRSLEEALFRQAASEAHAVEPQPDMPRAATRDEVTREVLLRVRSTIRGLGTRMNDPVAVETLARVEAAVDRLAETGFFVRPTLSDRDAALGAHADAEADADADADAQSTLHNEHAPEFQPEVQPGLHGDQPAVESPVGGEAWGAAEAFVVPTEMQPEADLARTATAVIDDRPLAERLSADVVAEVPEEPEPAPVQSDVVLPVPDTGPKPSTSQRGRRWRRRTSDE